MLEIYNALFEYKNSSTVAEQKMREFLACTKKQDGTPNYSAEEFQNDISDFYNKTNNFNNTNEPFVIYIEKQMKTDLTIQHQPKTDMKLLIHIH